MKGMELIFMRTMVDLVYNGETRIQESKCEEFLDIAIMQFKKKKTEPNM